MRKKLLLLVFLAVLIVPLLTACDTSTTPLPSGGTEQNDPADSGTPDTNVLEIGLERQVFWDEYIVDPALTDAVLTLNHPTQKEIVLTLDKPWEGNSCDYYSIVTIPREDGTVFYRMYYNGWDSAKFAGTQDIRICAVESEDGINWTRPDYGLYSFEGDEHTNIVMMNEYGFDNFFVFYDTNPECDEKERFKAVSEYLGPDDYGSLWGYVSPDGLNWKKAIRLRDTSQGTFDSVNTCFYNAKDNLYYLYYRGFHDNVRDIRVATAEGFWEFFLCFDAKILSYTDEYDFPLYTNNVQPYYRAPQVLMGLPTRYNDHGCEWTANMDELPDFDDRYMRNIDNPRTATTVTDTLFMTSRDGKTFDRFTSAWYTPGAEHSGNWIYGDGYFAYGMIETPTEFPDQAKELSLYTFEGKFKSDPSRLYRYTIRIDGFACYKAPSYEESVVTTRLFTMPDADKFLLNFATSGAGSIVVEILDKDGNPIEHYTSYAIFGDQVDREIVFNRNYSLRRLAGETVRLRFTMRDAEIYSFKFGDDGTDPLPYDPENGSEVEREDISDTVYEIGNDLQVVWDDYIIDPLMSTALLTVNNPIRKEAVATLDAPWESSCVYYSIVKIPRKDGTCFYRMYYKSTATVQIEGYARNVTCAIESEDGIHWTHPDYGLYSFDGNDHTNIVMMDEFGFGNFFVFYDTNPDCPENERFKAVSEYMNKEDYAMLWGYVSADGLHWNKIGRLRDRTQGTFDSLNTCFYNEADGLYYLYYRGFHGDVRDIRVATATTFADLLDCPDAKLLDYSDPYDFALYTNNVQQYYRAPQVTIGLPTRYNDHGLVWTDNLDYLPDRESRLTSFADNPRYGTTVTDTIFMTSRNGKLFDRFTSAWYTPGPEHSGNWVYGDGYFAYGMIETKTEYPLQANELSLYASEGKYLYRYANRIDGFASYKATSHDPSCVMTRLFKMPKAEKLLLNFATSGAGSIVIDIIDENGNKIEGYTSYEIFGDRVDREVTFGDADLSALEGRNVRLRFTMRDAEIYSFRIG